MTVSEPFTFDSATSPTGTVPKSRVTMRDAPPALVPAPSPQPASASAAATRTAQIGARALTRW